MRPAFGPRAGCYAPHLSRWVQLGATSIILPPSQPIASAIAPRPAAVRRAGCRYRRQLDHELGRARTPQLDAKGRYPMIALRLRSRSATRPRYRPWHPNARGRCQPHVMTLSPIPLLLLALIVAAPCAADPVDGLAMYGEPKHAPGFAHFPYVNPQAPKGGRLVLGELGTFDSLNPFIIRGVSPGTLPDYVYESLLARSGDEPFTLYGLIAESVEVPADRSFITFHLRAQARFSDGVAVTPEDVLFSFEVLRDRGWPYHRAHYSKVVKAERLDERSVRFTFASGGDREMPLILGLMPILPHHKLDAETFDRPTLAPPLGPGPSPVARVDPGRPLTFTRNPQRWARDLPISRGRYNFSEIRVDYFRDASALFEAFKAGEIDVRPEDDPGRWLEGYDISAAAE